MSDAEAPVAPPRSGAHALEAFLRRASVRGETAVAVTRLVLCLLALARLAVLHHDAFAAGSAKYWTASVALVVGVAFSVVTLRRFRHDREAHVRLLVSTGLDAALVSIVLLPVVLDPHPGYVGILREVDLAIYLLAVLGSSARLSPQAALVAMAANGAAVAGLVALDQRLHGVMTDAGGNLALFGVYFVATCTFTWAAVRGIRWLVREGGEAYALAERARQRLGVYVSEAVADQALDGELELGGHRRDVAILFSDLRGFTSYSEKISPERLVAELNAYFDAMLAAIEAEGGLVDKFIGDAIMAVFGVPERRPDAAAAAARAAAGMQAALTAHNAERAARDLPPLRQGIGVHHGPAVVGNIGTSARMQYTVIGDVVNVASRLEAATKELEVGVLVSADAVAAARASGGELPELRPRGELAVRGREEPMEVFALG